jgi:GR25 family glycosyltransferase involved in LPS biosynthesis
LPAIDGQALSSNEVAAAYRRARFAPRYPFALRRPEIGAFLSHRAAWRRIVDDGLDFAVIFEDDAAIDQARFAGLLEALQSLLGEWDYVLAPAAGLEPAGDILVEVGGFALSKPRAPPLRAIGQFVSRTAAARLLDMTAPFDRPVDTFLQMSWITGVPVLVATPTPIRDVSLESGGTTVQRRNKSILKRVAHEFFRPVYRAQILARHRREAARADWRPTVSPRIPNEQ